MRERERERERLNREQRETNRRRVKEHAATDSGWPFDSEREIADRAVQISPGNHFIFPALKAQ